MNTKVINTTEKRSIFLGKRKQTPFVLFLEETLTHKAYIRLHKTMNESPNQTTVWLNNPEKMPLHAVKVIAIQSKTPPSVLREKFSLGNSALRITDAEKLASWEEKIFPLK
jgi:hypothetical protein